MPVQNVLSPKDHWKVTALLIEYQDVFSSGDNDLGKTAVIKHPTKTESVAAISLKFAMHFLYSRW